MANFLVEAIDGNRPAGMRQLNGLYTRNALTGAMLRSGIFSRDITRRFWRRRKRIFACAAALCGTQSGACKIRHGIAADFTREIFGPRRLRHDRELPIPIRSFSFEILKRHIKISNLDRLGIRQATPQ